MAVSGELGTSWEWSVTQSQPPHWNPTKKIKSWFDIIMENIFYLLVEKLFWLCLAVVIGLLWISPPSLLLHPHPPHQPHQPHDPHQWHGVGTMTPALQALHLSDMSIGNHYHSTSLIFCWLARSCPLCTVQLLWLLHRFNFRVLSIIHKNHKN